jgi:hypothetical protein
LVRGVGRCLVASTANSENQGNQGRDVQELDDLRTARGCGCSFVVNPDTIVNGWLV